MKHTTRFKTTIKKTTAGLLLSVLAITPATLYAQDTASSSLLQLLASLTATSTTSSYEEQVLALVNVERRKYGLKALATDTQLQKVALIKSTDMRTNKYFSHTSPTYVNP